MSQLNDLIGRAAAQNASDIHLTVGLPPVFRIDGALQNDGEAILDEEAVAAMAKELANQRQIEELEHTGEVDFAVTVASSIRMRCNIFRQQGYTALALRLLPLRIPTAEELLLPQIIIEQAEKPRGLVLITGPTGSGKSSTLAALLDHINRTERRHIITLENPIEYVHERIQCVINQREVGSDTGSFASGLRAALRQDPDVILVGEMRDLEAISTAITAAETGHLVFGTLHTKGRPTPWTASLTCFRQISRSRCVFSWPMCWSVPLDRPFCRRSVAGGGQCLRSWLAQQPCEV